MDAGTCIQRLRYFLTTALTSQQKNPSSSASLNENISVFSVLPSEKASKDTKYWSDGLRLTEYKSLVNPMNSRRLGCALLYFVVLQCIYWRHTRKCYQDDSSMLCKGLFSCNFLKKVINILYVSFAFTHKSHFSMEEVTYIYQFNNVKPSLMRWERRKESRRRHSNHRLFHCCTFRNLKYTHPNPAHFTVQNRLLLTAALKWITSLFQLQGFPSIHAGLWVRPKAALL